MKEHEQGNGTSHGAGPSIAVGFVLGAIVGAGIALLCAPGTGSDTRRRIADAGRRWGGAARDALDQARDTANDLGQDVKSALEAGRDAFEHGDAPTATPPSPSEGSG